MENNKKLKRTTNRAQFGKMVMIMKEHPDIAKNLSKEGPEVVLEFWQQLKGELNALGPPIKECAEWKKVWSDYKSSLRKKLAHNKRELNSTGGGTNNLFVFTPLEEDVIQLVSLRDAVDGLPNTNKFGVPRKRTMHDANNASLQIENLPTADELVASGCDDGLLVENYVEVEIQNIETSTEMPQTKGPKQLKLLEKQIDIQQKLYENIAKFVDSQNQRWEDFNSYQKRLYRAVEKLSDRQKEANEILKAQLEETKRHNQRKEQLFLEKK